MLSFFFEIDIIVKKLYNKFINLEENVTFYRREYYGKEKRTEE